MQGRFYNSGLAAVDQIQACLSIKEIKGASRKV